MAQNAPEAAVAAEAQETPPQEQTPEPAISDQAPDQRPAPASDQELITPAVFTQRSQEVAAVRRALGLPPKAGGDEILGALTALQRRAEGAAAGDDEIVDPRIASRIAEADERLWKSLAYVHGETAGRAREFADYARTTRDPEALVEKFYEIMPRGTPAPPPTPAQQGGTTAEAPVPPAAVGLPDSDTRPSGASNEAIASEEFRNTGNVDGFLRRLGLFGSGKT